MAQLQGFQKRSGTGAASSDQMIRILEKTYLNRTEGGEFSNESEVQGLIDALGKMPQTPDVMEKVADLENKKLGMKSKFEDITNSKALFEDNLNDALRLEARNNYKDMGMLIGNYMNVYADAEERIDTYINDNVYKRYGSSATVPQELIDLKNSIKEKARYYSTLTALISTPEGIGSLNAEGLAVQVQTNPLTGNIISLDVVPRGEVDAKSYMETDIKAKIDGTQPLAVPIYVNASNDKVTPSGVQTKFGRLGSMEFRGADKLTGSKDEIKTQEKDLEGYGIGKLAAQNENVSMWAWLNPFYDSPEEKAKKGLDSARTEGMTFNDFNFDGNDIPPKSMVRKGNRLYFQQENGDVSEFDGADYREKAENAKKYLTQVGLDPNKVGAPLYADDVYFVAPDGSSRIKEKIGADYFAPQLPPTQGASVFTAPTSTSTASSTPENPNLLSSFFGNTNRPDMPNTQMKTTTPSFIDKAQSFFKK